MKEAFDQDCLELKDLGEAFERLSSDALDVAVIPARMIHGNQLKLLSSGLVVSGAMNQNRPFHVMVSDDRVRHLPRALHFIEQLKNSKEATKKAQAGLPCPLTQGMGRDQ